jgi:apolipoprotein D and lipocalin family protein
MKVTSVILLSFIALFTGKLPNKTVEKVDLKRFAGTWYCLYSIPTMFDRGTREMTTRYTWNSDGYYDVYTTCKKDGPELHSFTSKIFQVKGTNNSQMKAQFIWPIKVDYWVIALGSDYSYTVVGHPDHKFLYIMSRKPEMDKALYQHLVEQCREMGYPVEKLVSQQFPGEGK